MRAGYIYGTMAGTRVSANMKRVQEVPYQYQVGQDGWNDLSCGGAVKCVYRQVLRPNDHLWCNTELGHPFTISSLMSLVSLY